MLEELHQTLERHKQALRELETAPITEATRKKLIDNYKALIDDYEFMIGMEVKIDG